MGALTQMQEAVTSSNEEVNKRILHNSLCFIAYFQRKKQQLKLSSHSNKAKSRLRKGVLKHLVRKPTEEIKSISEENEVDNRLPGNDVPSELSRRVDSTTNLNKRRSFGVGVHFFPLAKVFSRSKDVDALRGEIEALNKSLQEEKMIMRKELDEIKEQLQTLLISASSSAAS